MRLLAKSFSPLFSAGCFGGVLRALMEIFLVKWQLLPSLAENASLTHFDWMAPRILIGGMMGFLLLLPVKKSKILRASFIISLVPTAFTLFLFGPGGERGFLMQHPDKMYWLGILIVNFVWAFGTIHWMTWLNDYDAEYRLRNS